MAVLLDYQCTLRKCDYQCTLRKCEKRGKGKKHYFNSP